MSVTTAEPFCVVVMAGVRKTGNATARVIAMSDTLRKTGFPFYVETKVEWKPAYATTEKEEAIKQANEYISEHIRADCLEVRVFDKNGAIIFSFIKIDGEIKEASNRD